MSHNGEVSAVALKLPPFWSKMPSAWFVHCEANFSTRNISVEKTKYDYIIAGLSEEHVSAVFDVIQSISENQDATPYTTIKKALIERFSLSESARLESLLSGTELGDRKPSEFFRVLKTLAGSSDTVTEKLVLSLWTRRLPPMVQATLKAINKDATTSELLTLADNVFEIYQQQLPGTSVCSMSIPSSNTKNRDIERLESEISEIKKMISDMRFDSGHNRNRSHSRNRAGSSRSSSKNRSDMCYYHSKYGTKARNCRQPCSFKGQSKSPN